MDLLPENRLWIAGHDEGEMSDGATMRSGRGPGLVARAIAVALMLAAAGPGRAEEAPYDDTLAHLAEVLGALHHLRPLCGAPEAQTWRDQMNAVLEAEQPGPARRQRFVDRFNLAYRGFVATHPTCTPAARALAETYRREGEALGREVLTRWGRP